MQDLVIDIFLLCLINNEQGNAKLSFSYEHYSSGDCITISKKVCDNWKFKGAYDENQAIEIKNYLETITNGGQGDESIWD